MKMGIKAKRHCEGASLRGTKQSGENILDCFAVARNDAARHPVGMHRSVKNATTRAQQHPAGMHPRRELIINN